LPVMIHDTDNTFLQIRYSSHIEPFFILLMHFLLLADKECALSYLAEMV
jgi:hypothetical protein